jgi:CBS domain-containing protein
VDEHDLSQLLVESALEPVRYRVYPETPLSEIVDLMVRRKVRAIPVVGESFEVLGIITAGDALSRVLKERPAEAAGEAGKSELAARDVMTRSVLCVSESQRLLEAAHMMVNRDVEQLPVVRDGHLVGLLTRDAILRALHLGAPRAKDTESKDTESSDP